MPERAGLVGAVSAKDATREVRTSFGSSIEAFSRFGSERLPIPQSRKSGDECS